MKRIFLLLLASLSLALAQQNADPLVFTVGKTFETNGGTTRHNYLLWQPGDAATTFGKRFAVYAKPGAADAAGNFNRLAVQTLQMSPSAIQAILKLGAKLDHNAGTLPARITALHAEAQSQIFDPDNAPTEITPEIAQKLAQVITAAQTDTEILQSLLSLGRAHAGVMMALGHGFAITVDPASVITYEVREVDGADADLRIIGRVTLDAAAPSTLVAPGRPYEVPVPVEENYQLNASAKNHLNARFRWATPDALREITPLTYGFNLYRVPEDAVADPDLITTEAQALVAGVRVNNLPIASRGLFTEGQAADLTYETDTFFYTDLKDPPEDPFQNGDTFFYYVAARDIAGHPGPFSPPTRVVMCDRLPPSQPSIVSVDNIFDLPNSDPATGTGKQHLRVVIRQVPEEPIENRAYKYRIYRWHAATDWQRHGGDPEFNFVGEVDHIEGELYVTFDDDDPTDLDTDYVSAADNGPDTGSPVCDSQDDFPMGKTYWYTVRAVDAAACDPPNYSGHSGAVYGVPRDRVGPAKPSGSITICSCLPRIFGAEEIGEARKISYDLSRTFGGFVVRGSRINQQSPRRIFKKIRTFQVQYGRTVGGEFSPRFNRIHYFRGMEAFADIVIPIRPSGGGFLRVRACLNDGTFSSWREIGVSSATLSPSVLDLYTFNLTVVRQCKDINIPPGGTPPGHGPFGLDDKAEGVCGKVNIPDDAREVRIYRRVGRGNPFQLIARQAGDSLPAVYEWKEKAPVLQNGAVACYFALLLDENGNSSPLVKHGCITVVNPDMGTPLLSDPVVAGPFNGTGLVQLNWFCDPVGVDRFEVLAASEGKADPGIISESLNDAPGDELVNLTVKNKDLSFTVYQTPSLESGFGNGGQYSIILGVPANQKTHYVVRPVGPMYTPNAELAFRRSIGEFSNVVSKKWSAPLDELQDVIPWPARPLSELLEIGLDVSSYIPGEGPFHAHAMAPTDMEKFNASGAILVGAFPSKGTFSQDGTLAPDSQATFFKPETPMDWLFGYRLHPTEEVMSKDLIPLSSFVVYRHQVPSERYPSARANLVQVTPLIDQISYGESPDPDCFLARDPFFIFAPVGDVGGFSGFPVPTSGKFSRDPKTYSTANVNPLPDYLKRSFPLSPGQDVNSFGYAMWVKDALPVAAGASYQYLIVHFGERGEIARIIPTNTISH